MKGVGVSGLVADKIRSKDKKFFNRFDQLGAVLTLPNLLPQNLQQFTLADLFRNFIGIETQTDLRFSNNGKIQRQLKNIGQTINLGLIAEGVFRTDQLDSSLARALQTYFLKLLLELGRGLCSFRGRS